MYKIAFGTEHFAIAFISTSGMESVVKLLKSGLPKAFDKSELMWRCDMY
jgi:hypothetical protein